MAFYYGENMELEEFINLLSTVIDYIENYVIESEERNTALIKLKESVFWLTYLLEE